MILNYAKNPKYAGEGYSDIDQFILKIKEYFYNLEPIYITLEPGDVTKYQFLICFFGGWVTVSCQMANNWCVNLNPRGTVFKHHFQSVRNVNPHTIALICEIMNRIIDASQNDFDFEEGRAVL